MPDSDEPRTPTRKSSPSLTVYLLPEEMAQIKNNARAVGLTASTFLRQVGMGYAPASAIDHDCVDLICKVNADQARLGNLLKLWLSDDDKLSRFDPDQIRATILLAMERIKECQVALLAAASRL